MTRIIDGPKKRQDAINKLRDCLPENPPSVRVILFTPPEDAAYDVAAVSAREKLKTFREANVQAKFVNDDNWQSFGSSSIEGVLASNTLKIVQQPLPREISDLPIKNDLDVNSSNGRCLPAVCEAVDLAFSDLGERQSRRPSRLLKKFR